MSKKILLPAAALIGFTLACGSGEPPPPSELEDTKDLCEAILESDEGDAATDAAINGLTLGTPWGQDMQGKLTAGDEMAPEAMDALVAKIKETKASDESLDCTLIEGLWGAMDELEQELEAAPPTE